jgi:hypothetical protein
MAAVESLRSDVETVKPITMWEDGILQPLYQPSPPSFTTRTIISSVASSKSPPFHVSIHCPPSAEERARLMQASERSALLRRLVLATVIGIPTFLMGVVFMSLVKGDNPTRVFLTKPMWAGNALNMSNTPPALHWDYTRLSRRCGARKHDPMLPSDVRHQLFRYAVPTISSKHVWPASVRLVLLVFKSYH